MFGGIDRKKINWFPTIDYDKCIGCQECYNFCRNGVYEWDEENNRPKVVNPYNCVLGCSSCANLCEQKAISFPTMKQLKEMIEKAKKE
jgi:NAD-dependent dihydropyrimidine dehydrogenase PreA subunit